MTEQNSNTNLEQQYPWVDDVSKEGADYEPNDLNNNLMHLKYVHKPKNVAGRNIGDIFWTMRLDETLNGAYPCDGGEFVQSDFTGDNNPYELLVLGRIPSVTFAEYAQEMADNNGNCGFFALDTENQKFKLPTLHKISIEASKIQGDIGKYIQDQIVNITGTFGADDRMINTYSGAFSSLGGGYGTGSSGAESGCAFKFDASSVVNTGDRVKPKTISLRAMVQLANEVEDAISIETYTNRIEEKTQEGISNLNSASTCLTQSQVTNCIIEAPNNIKVDINANGELVLLAGSTIIIPYGFNEDGTRRFEHRTLKNDVVFDHLSSFSGTVSNFMPLIWFDEMTNSSCGGVKAAELFSGATAPTSSFNAYWYDTENNLIKFSGNYGASWSSGMVSFPFCQVDIIVESAAVKYYDNPKVIYDYCGFIGSVFWIDKGVKVLMPNGKNDDGTFKNMELSTENVLIEMITSDESANYATDARAFISESALFWWSDPTTFPKYVTPNGNSVLRYFDTDKNVWKQSFNSKTYSDEITCPFANFSINSANQILSMTPYTVLAVNNGTNYAHVVETYSNGASWYRVWSDGWIEQGGDTTETQITDVTYTKPFKNRPFVTASATDGTTASTFVAITNITTSGFRTISGGWHPSGSIVGALGTVVKTWYACGY